MRPDFAPRPKWLLCFHCTASIGESISRLALEHSTSRQPLGDYGDQLANTGLLCVLRVLAAFVLPRYPYLEDSAIYCKLLMLLHLYSKQGKMRYGTGTRQ